MTLLAIKNEMKRLKSRELKELQLYLIRLRHSTPWSAPSGVLWRKRMRYNCSSFNSRDLSRFISFFIARSVMGPTMFSEALAVKMARVNVVNDPRFMAAAAD